jgi:hypothetical protein
MAASVALGVTLALFYCLRLQTVSRAQHLADGSWLKIRDVVVAEELSRTFPDGNLVQRTLDRIVPDRWSSALPWPVRSRLFPRGSASLHLSGEGKACLFILTGRYNLPTAGEFKFNHIVVDDGHEHDMNTNSCQVTVDACHQRIQGWAVEEGPKNSRTLRVRCFAAGQEDRLVEVAQFTIRNPAYGRRSK